MNVKDSQKASSAAVLMVAGLSANLVLTVLSYAVNWLVPGSYDGPFPIILDLLWLGASGVLVVGLLQLAQAVDEPSVLFVSAAVLIVNALLDAWMTLVGHKLAHTLGAPIGQLAYDVSMLVSLVSRGLLLFCLARLAMKTHAWVVPLLGTVALLSLMRSAFSLASIHHLVESGLYGNPLYRYVMPLVGLFNASAMIFAALGVKSAVSGAPNTPALVAAAGLRPAPPTPISAGADFLVGGILLAVGVGVTVVSLTAASNGGRYVVATGAIAVGITRIIRGFIRLGRAGSSQR